MSLYREATQTGRQALIVGAIALLVGLAGGYLLGSSGSEEPTLDQALTALRGELAPVSDGLELLGGEYPQGVKNGEIAAQTEYEGSISNIDRLTATVNAHRADLEDLDPEATAELVATLNELATAVEAKAPPSEVNRLRRQARSDLETLLPGPAT